MPIPDLRGLRVLVTRPEHQADALCAEIREAGGQAIRFPMLEIVDPEDLTEVRELIDKLETFDLAVFVSSNAVARALKHICALRKLPTALQLATIGKGSARTLQALLGRAPDICPAHTFNSEALLAEPALQEVSGRRIVIFRGEGGREYLASTLSARGADVTYATVYRRRIPRLDVAALSQAIRGKAVDVITITSGEALRNLVSLVEQSALEALFELSLVVVNTRLAALATELGFRHPAIVASEASDAALLEALQGLAKNTDDD